MEFTQILLDGYIQVRVVKYEPLIPNMRQEDFTKSKIQKRIKNTCKLLQCAITANCTLPLQLRFAKQLHRGHQDVYWVKIRRPIISSTTLNLNKYHEARVVLQL